MGEIPCIFFLFNQFKGLFTPIVENYILSYLFYEGVNSFNISPSIVGYEFVFSFVYLPMHNPWKKSQEYLMRGFFVRILR